MPPRPPLDPPVVIGLLVCVRRCLIVAAAAVKMLRLRSRMIQLSSGDWLSRQHLTSRRVCPARVAAVTNQRRYASAENVDYKPIKKLLVANRGNSTAGATLLLLVSLDGYLDLRCLYVVVYTRRLLLQPLLMLGETRGTVPQKC